MDTPEAVAVVEAAPVEAPEIEHVAVLGDLIGEEVFDFHEVQQIANIARRAVGYREGRKRRRVHFEDEVEEDTEDTDEEEYVVAEQSR